MVDIVLSFTLFLFSDFRQSRYFTVFIVVADRFVSRVVLRRLFLVFVDVRHSTFGVWFALAAPPILPIPRILTSASKKNVGV